MIVEIKVPSPGESITQVQLASWLVQDGDFVEKDAEVAEIDSDKATLSVSAAESGIVRILIEEGATIAVGQVICTIDTSAERPAGAPTPPAKSAGVKVEPPEVKPVTAAEPTEALPAETPAASGAVPSVLNASPLARKIMQEKGITESEFIAFLKKHRVGRDDVMAYQTQTPGPALPLAASRSIERKKMSTLRIKLSERLVGVKNQTAMLTTFNEVNMTPITELRAKYKDAFSKKYGYNIGFMSFFTKAATIALQAFPQVNAIIEGDELVYHQYADIGIAVSSPKGLMVPVLRNAESLSLHEIESQIKELADKARTNKITIEEMTGGTFTITNGGVFGSMLSTPILNPPQSAILGMHNIVERPIAVNGKVEIHPIMYLALSYDHRVIDGRESVSFLVTVRNLLENPVRMLFDGRDPGEVLLGL